MYGFAGGVCAALHPQDQAFSGHRAHAHYLAKGGSLDAMMAEIYGKATGCSKGKGGSMHLVDQAAGFLGSTAIVGGTIPLAVGAALTSKLLASGRVACTFFGDAAVEEGVFYESANFAVLKKLPVIFLCENNLYSVYSPMEVRQPPRRSIAQMVSALGMTVCEGDGNNVEEVYRKVLNGRQHAADGKGPVFFEFFTYRWREHCGPHFDNDLGYRTEEEYESWRARDPIANYEERLLSSQVLTQETAADMTAQVRDRVEEAFRFAENSPFPDPSEAYQHVYASTPGESPCHDP
jgi:pyruvate dehydrogenase E1 component alpha subunit